MSKVLIIAEAGVNHNGDIHIAKKLIEETKRCGADIVKFQTFDPKKLASKYAVMAEYQKENLGIEESQEKMLGRLALKQEEYAVLAEYCREVGIQFLSTPFDIESIHFLEKMQDIWKVPSGEITNYPYLLEIARTGKPVIMSTGMSNIDEIAAAIELLRRNGSGEINLLHCNTQYPTPYQDVNLRAMLTLKKQFKVTVGYSDHTLGIEVPIAAVAMGAEIIEKHFTLDRNMEGPDHKASLEPDELMAMVTSIRHIEQALGDGEKKVSESERANLAIARKSIVAKRNISKGEKFTEENITTKRPGNGISPMKWPDILGKTAETDFKEDELITLKGF